MAYGARLESVLGASPRGFESPILRHRTPGPLQVPGFCCPRCRWFSGAARSVLWARLARVPMGGGCRRAFIALLRPGLVPLDSEAFDDLCARECSQDLARHKELRSTQA